MLKQLYSRLNNTAMTKKSIITLIIGLFVLQHAWNQNIPATTMNYVSVDPETGDVEISWNVNSDIDVDGYYIYRYDNDLLAYLYIDDVPGRTSVFYTNFASPTSQTSSMAASESETYSVVAYDGNIEGTHPDYVQSTIYLSSVFRPCYSEIKLNWTPYKGWPSGVYNYKIYYRIDLAPWSFLDIVDGDVLSYGIHELDPDRDYYFYVEAIGGGNLASTSNQVQEFTLMPHPPVNFKANFATVQSENYIDLSFQIDTSADVIQYVLLRSDSLDGDIDTVNVFMPEPNEEQITYTDHAQTHIVHYYKLIAINTCGVPFTKTTNYASNIVLEATAQNDLHNQVIWTNYFDWDQGISHYNVYRSVDYFDPILIMQVAYGDSVHLDRLDEFLYNPLHDPSDPFAQIVTQNEYLEQPVVSGNMCYYVTAYEFPGTDTSFTSTSNKVCVSQMPRVFIPNAFSPNSDDLNDIFYPFISFAGLSQYELRIFNRWGNLVFRTIHLHQGWNGTQFDGQTKAPIGTYVYKLSFIDGEGVKHQKTGSVTLIR